MRPDAAADLEDLEQRAGARASRASGSRGAARGHGNGVATLEQPLLRGTLLLALLLRLLLLALVAQPVEQPARHLLLERAEPDVEHSLALRRQLLLQQRGLAPVHDPRELAVQHVCQSRAAPRVHARRVARAAVRDRLDELVRELGRRSEELGPHEVDQRVVPVVAVAERA